jgi:hypothetical protein
MLAVGVGSGRGGRGGARGLDGARRGEEVGGWCGSAVTYLSTSGASADTVTYLFLNSVFKFYLCYSV